MRPSHSRQDMVSTFRAKLYFKQADDNLHILKNRIKALRIREERIQKKIRAKVNRVESMSQSRLQTEQVEPSTSKQAPFIRRSLEDRDLSSRSPNNNDKENSLFSNIYSLKHQHSLNSLNPPLQSPFLPSGRVNNSKFSIDLLAKTGISFSQSRGKGLSAHQNLNQSSLLSLKQIQAEEIKQQSRRFDQKMREMKQFNRLKNVANRDKVLDFETGLRKKIQQLTLQNKKNYLIQKQKVVQQMTSGRRMKESIISMLEEEQQQLVQRLSQSRAAEEQLGAQIYRMEKNAATRHQQRRKEHTRYV